MIVTGDGPAMAAGAAALRAGSGAACVGAAATVPVAFADSTGRFVVGFGAGVFAAGLRTGAVETEVMEVLTEA